MEEQNDLELKCRINQFIWETAPGQMTMESAEKLACIIFDAMHQSPIPKEYRGNDS